MHKDNDWQLIMVGTKWYTADELLELSAKRFIVLDERLQAFVDKCRSKESYWRYLWLKKN